jgi:hypothetical protein
VNCQAPGLGFNLYTSEKKEKSMSLSSLWLAPNSNGLPQVKVDYTTKLLVEGVPFHRADVQQFKESHICIYLI